MTPVTELMLKAPCEIPPYVICPFIPEKRQENPQILQLKQVHIDGE